MAAAAKASQTINLRAAHICPHCTRFFTASGVHNGFLLVSYMFRGGPEDIRVLNQSGRSLCLMKLFWLRYPKLQQSVTFNCNASSRRHILYGFFRLLKRHEGHHYSSKICTRALVGQIFSSWDSLCEKTLEAMALDGPSFVISAVDVPFPTLFPACLGLCHRTTKKLTWILADCLHVGCKTVAWPEDISQGVSVLSPQAIDAHSEP